MTGPDTWARHLDPYRDRNDGTRDGTSRDALDVDPDPEGTRMIREILADEATWDEPPAGLRDSVLAAALGGGTADPPDVPAETVTPSTVTSLDAARHRRRTWAAAVAGALVGAAAAAAVAVVVDRPAAPGDTFVLAATAADPDAVVTAEIDPLPAGVAITLQITGLDPAPEGAYYAAWVTGPGGTVPVGSFHWREGGVPIELWSGVATDDYPTLLVTLEQEGSAPGPTGTVVLEGPISG